MKNEVTIPLRLPSNNYFVSSDQNSKIKRARFESYMKVKSQKEREKATCILSWCDEYPLHMVSVKTGMHVRCVCAVLCCVCTMRCVRWVGVRVVVGYACCVCNMIGVMAV